MMMMIFLSFFWFLENNWVRLWIRKIPSLWEGKGAAPPAGNCQFAAIFSLSHLIQYILIDHWWYQANCQLIWCQLISVWVDFYWLIFGGCCDLGAGFPPFSRDRSRISIHIVAGKMIELSNESELIWIIHSLGFSGFWFDCLGEGTADRSAAGCAPIAGAMMQPAPIRQHFHHVVTWKFRIDGGTSVNK